MSSMLAWTLFFVISSQLALAGHFLRQLNIGLFLVFLSAPLLLFYKRKWIVRAIQILLSIGILEWMSSLYLLVITRIQTNQPWLRLVIIFSAVILFALLAIILLQRKKFLDKYQEGPTAYLSSLWTFILTISILSVVMTIVRSPIMLIMDRFLPTMGWFEIFLLGIYGAVVVEKIQNNNSSSLWRGRIWRFFSLVFFAQLLLGLLGWDTMLMTGKLHLPVPALVAAGPLYRGEKFFMSILFISTLIIVGPAWCSHLCYIGAWDHACANQIKVPKPLANNRKSARLIIFLTVILTALIMRFLDTPGYLAATIAGSFGILGIVVMATYSRKSGTMFHCITWCPIGLLANIFGKLSPFRIKILKDCDNCFRCRKHCRYNALTKTDILNRKPGLTCTLCGDCIGSCRSGQLVFSFLNFDHAKAKKSFYVLVISLHAAFLGLARI